MAFKYFNNSSPAYMNDVFKAIVNLFSYGKKKDLNSI